MILGQKINTLLRLARKAGRSAVKAGADVNAMPPGAMDFLAEGRRAINQFNMTFLKAMTVETDRGCWEWIGNKCTDGYGQVSFYGQIWMTHRASYFIAHRKIPSGRLILHNCDNPPCINPQHLYAGNMQQNMVDSIVRQRRHDVRLKPKEVLEIRNRHSLGISTRVLSDHYKVSQNHIRSIVRRNRWRHIL